MSNTTDAVRGLLKRALPFLRDEATHYEDDGSNEPLELAREIEAALAEQHATPAVQPPHMIAVPRGALRVVTQYVRDGKGIRNAVMAAQQLEAAMDGRSDHG